MNGYTARAVCSDRVQSLPAGLLPGVFTPYTQGGCCMTTADIERLNRAFAIDKHVRFASGPGGLVVAHIDNPHATAMVALQGAHVMTYQPRGQEPVLWLSGHAKFSPGKSIRGGVPICWPWFGPHACEPAFPGHGFARTVLWEVLSTQATGAGASCSASPPPARTRSSGRIRRT